MGPEPQLSADGQWWWDGYRWVSMVYWAEYQDWLAAQAQPAQQPAARRRGHTPWLAITAALALAALALWSSGLTRLG
jgi:hypothetical protein